MMQKGYFLAPVALLLIAACSGGSQLPEPTGKASVRAINAIPGSPAIEFLIEERTIANVAYQSTSGGDRDRYDDFSYTFNFEVRFAGNTEDTRIVSQQIDFVAGADYTLVLTGTIASPAVTVWESVERVFDSSDTVFQSRFAHNSATWNTVDVYFAPDGTAPVPGEQVATLSTGEVSAPLDFAGGDYVVTVTVPKSPGETIDPADILYVSSPTTIAAQNSLIIAAFDGTADNVAPVVVRGLAANGTSFTMPDPTHLSTIEFMHGSFDIGDIDVYDDEMLTSQLIGMHTFSEITPEMPIATAEHSFRFTSAGTTTLLFESSLFANPGLRYRHVTLGSGGTYLASTVVSGRARIDTAVKVLAYQTSSNFDLLNFYAVDQGAAIEDNFPFLLGLSPGTSVAAVALPAGAYDLYVTESGEITPLAGPVQVDVQLGDVLDIVVFDTVDPAVLEMRILN